MSNILHTSVGDLDLHEYRSRIGGREWSILHTDAVLTYNDEFHYLNERDQRVPYGLALWPSAVALAHEVASRGSALRGARVLELGAGTGLPGIVAASLGALVTQTDREEVALSVCKRNGERNGIANVAYRNGDWKAWDDDARYDIILAADVLYAEAVHEPLRAIFARNLTPNGVLLLSDPYRASSLDFLEAMERDGWRIEFSKWTVDVEDDPRPIGVYECRPPA